MTTELEVDKETVVTDDVVVAVEFEAALEIYPYDEEEAEVMREGAEDVTLEGAEEAIIEDLAFNKPDVAGEVEVSRYDLVEVEWAAASDADATNRTASRNGSQKGEGENA